MIDLRNTIYFQVNAEVWNFFKEALPVRDDDHYWNEILIEGEKLAKKYENTQQSQFAKDQIFTVIGELERIRKAGSFDSFKLSETEGKLKS